MHAHTDYKITINGSEDAVQKIGQVLKSTITDVEFDVGAIINIDETYKCVFEDEVCELATNMAKVAPDAGFVMEGVIDTSESAGEYKNFRFELSGGKLCGQFSDWYTQDWMESFEDYEDFTDCIEYENVTEEEYNKFKTYEFLFTLETENGDIFSDHVPLGKPFQVAF